mmetsp:Transcript_15427/g.33442  ORF Transcript_15427/g.33442 Transcript_15427/m.33442 type:complete len:415 (+) Transcript_15427:198-1442(+)|eukprot:CAMPEP_0202894180 /NCGR_PEP_ID=MMETSP1392-20130828/3625_1 /ASSEMBLY_ACC=CAM_ASM_000868 /TAXON_ID=225041 /ORGANISM="Chlamydomonas chlamydogama, Strain SAG 11-48b" /LENGTH=414 /DNA_ID=CAMNT_0049578783 /DNA_START=182 /DNA_END=1426 /DNA_ORIENTATION=+
MEEVYHASSLGPDPDLSDVAASIGAIPAGPFIMDLDGRCYSGRAATSLVLCRDGLELRNGTIKLQNGDRIVVMPPPRASCSSRSSSSSSSSSSASRRSSSSSGGCVKLSNITITCEEGYSQPILSCEGGRLFMQDCQVISRASGEAPTVMASHSAWLHISSCKFTNSGTAPAVKVHGKGTELALHDCAFSECGGTCVEVSEGASAHLGSCVLNGSASSRGLHATGPGTRVVVRGCKVLDHLQQGILITKGARCELLRCHVSGSKKQAGILVKGHKSRLNMHDCFLHTCFAGCLVVDDGATAEAEGSHMCNSVSGPGMLVRGAGSHTTARGCEFGGNHGVGVEVVDGADVELVDDCVVVNNRKGNGGSGVAVLATGPCSKLLIGEGTAVLDGDVLAKDGSVLVRHDVLAHTVLAA